MKTGKIIMQGEFYSLFYDNKLFTRQFPVSANIATIIEVLGELMPDYLFTVASW